MGDMMDSDDNLLACVMHKKMERDKAILLPWKMYFCRPPSLTSHTVHTYR